MVGCGGVESSPREKEPTPKEERTVIFTLLLIIVAALVLSLHRWVNGDSYSRPRPFSS